MNKFKKILLMSGIAVSIGELSACNKQADNQFQSDEMLTVPEYQTQELTQAVGKASNQYEIIDGYEVIPVNFGGQIVNTCVPYLESSVKGVYYAKDEIIQLAGGDYVKYSGINCPEGADYIEQIVAGYSGYWTFGTQPDLGINAGIDKDLIVFGEKMPELHLSRQLFHIYSEGSSDINTTKTQMGKCTEDIQCITVALYEDFYEKRPDMNLKVYGVPNSVWEKYHGSEMIFSFPQNEEFMETCKDNGYSECTLLGEKEITETGVYYVDIKELSKQGDFAQYILTVDFSESMEYTYRICCDDTYNVEEKNVKLYEAWKEEHKEQFIAGGEN